MNLSICIWLALLVIICFLVMHLINLKYEIEKIRSCLNMNCQVLDCSQERNRNYRLIILEKDKKIDSLIRQLVGVESIKSPPPLIVKANGDKVLYEEQE